MNAMNAMNAMILNSGHSSSGYNNSNSSNNNSNNSSKAIVDGYDITNGKFNVYVGQQYERQSFQHSSHSPVGHSLAEGVLVRLRVLLDAYDMLTSVYTQKREITQDDAHTCVIASFNRNKHRPMSDTNAYVSLIVESLVPKIANDGTIKLQIKPTHDVVDKFVRYTIV